jgi:hypothetical protein
MQTTLTTATTTEARANAPHAVSAPACAAQPTTCSCGVPLPAPPPKGGRPRRHCSAACRRAWQNRQRKIARRRDALALWRQERPGEHYSRARIRQEVRDLSAEIAALEVMP